MLKQQVSGERRIENTASEGERSCVAGCWTASATSKEQLLQVFSQVSQALSDGKNDEFFVSLFFSFLSLSSFVLILSLSVLLLSF